MLCVPRSRHTTRTIVTVLRATSFLPALQAHAARRSPGSLIPSLRAVPRAIARGGHLTRMPIAAMPSGKNLHSVTRRPLQKAAARIIVGAGNGAAIDMKPGSFIAPVVTPVQM